MKKIKDAATFLKNTGLIFEINRKILHPLGLALETKTRKDGTEEFAELVDGRDDPEGIVYSAYCFELGLKKLLYYLQQQGRDALKSRVAKLGWMVQKLKKG